jgi:hypothetical protein
VLFSMQTSAYGLSDVPFQDDETTSQENLDHRTTGSAIAVHS